MTSGHLGYLHTLISCTEYVKSIFPLSISIVHTMYSIPTEQRISPLIDAISGRYIRTLDMFKIVENTYTSLEVCPVILPSGELYLSYVVAIRPTGPPRLVSYNPSTDPITRPACKALFGSSLAIFLFFIQHWCSADFLDR